MTLFSNYIQAGRLAVGRFGSIVDKPCVVVDIVTLTRVIVVVPGEGRMVVPVKRLAMTDFKLDLSRGASIADVEQALQSNDVISQWKQTAWGKKLNNYSVRKQLTDFERFKISRARKMVNQA